MVLNFKHVSSLLNYYLMYSTYGEAANKRGSSSKNSERLVVTNLKLLNVIVFYCNLHSI